MAHAKLYNYAVGQTDGYLGQVYGRLTVIDTIRKKGERLRLRCRCSCGNEHTALAMNIRRGATSSCGCLKREQSSLRAREHAAIAEARQKQAEGFARERRALVGRRYGRLVVEDVIVTGKRVRFRCVCDCGNKTLTTRGNLERGHTKSCGCLQVYRHPVRNVGLRKLYYRYRHAAKRRDLAFDLDLDTFRDLTSGPCRYCGTDPNYLMRSKSDHSEYSYNGVDRLDSDVGYVSENVVTCCATCNRMKSDHPVGEFVRHLRRVLEHLEKNAL
jgi:hypothetical protein